MRGISFGLCRVVVRRTFVQTSGGGVLHLRDGNAIFESVAISDTFATVSPALAADANWAVVCGGRVCRRGDKNRPCVRLLMVA
jgi:hypothetical protein